MADNHDVCIEIIEPADDTTSSSSQPHVRDTTKEPADDSRDQRDTTKGTEDRLKLLEDALKKNQWEGVKKIIDYEPDIIYRSIGFNKGSALVYAIRHNLDMGIIENLIDMMTLDGINYMLNLVYAIRHTRYKKQISGLYWAVKKVNYSAVKLIVEKFPFLLCEIIDNDERTVIEEALYDGNEEMACYLVKIGLSAASHEGVYNYDQLNFSRLLKYATARSHIDFARILVQQCPRLADDHDIIAPAATDTTKGTEDRLKLLEDALNKNQREGVKKIIDDEPDIVYRPMRDEKGIALAYAIRQDLDMGIIKNLIDMMTGDGVRSMRRVCDTNDRKDISGLYWAVEKLNYSAIKLIVEKFPFLLRDTNDDGRTPIEEALYSGNKETACYLMIIALSAASQGVCDYDDLNFLKLLDYAITWSHYGERTSILL